MTCKFADLVWEGEESISISADSLFTSGYQSNTYSLPVVTRSIRGIDLEFGQVV